MSSPDLVEQYIEYCRHLKNFRENRNIDLSNTDFLYPTTLLPLCNLILANPDSYVPPNDPNVSNYVSTIIGGTGSTTYVPIVSLPRNESEREEALQKVYRLRRGEPNLLGGEASFKYVVQEMTDNIYQHSHFNNATITAQKYPNKGYVDICFFDDGITIPRSFANKGMTFQPYTAIAEAINGLSTRDFNRGFGLRTCVRLFLEGLKGKIFVVSGAGGVYFEGTSRTLYELTNLTILQGTLISLRVPLSTPQVNIYDYVE